MKRKIRRSFDTILTLLGIGIIFASVWIGTTSSLQIQLIIVLLGILAMEMGIWGGLSSNFLPSDRRFDGLRKEGNNILRLIRELNSAAIARDEGEEGGERFEGILEKMHTSVTHMAELAAKENPSAAQEDPPADSAEVTGDE